MANKSNAILHYIRLQNLNRFHTIFLYTVKGRIFSRPFIVQYLPLGRSVSIHLYPFHAITSNKISRFSEELWLACKTNSKNGVRKLYSFLKLMNGAGLLHESGLDWPLWHRATLMDKGGFRGIRGPFWRRNTLPQLNEFPMEANGWFTSASNSNSGSYVLFDYLMLASFSSLMKYLNECLKYFYYLFWKFPDKPFSRM